ncbi:MAG: transcriptional regulator [Rhodospirillales bacterium]|nr:transcriptional regulator [Rhodospirillales bacterium]MCW8863124.1 transcriptional regulator [Rhodospirillales bacterium]MCW8951332.1 transcriptional regulator [Rhodospirillales bacterium]MCW8970526.1 transcriptional regulator [Rhodospirillales bacterium]MCW9040744.1 transcriptional regulator [Rhodospirillales bacterium]
MKNSARSKASRGLRRTTFGLLLVFIAMTASTKPQAAQLLMFESDTCEWCDAWHREIGVVYHKTKEGKLLELRRIDVNESRPNDLRDIKGIVFTPTFVVFDGKNEIGRIVGYPGESFFWGLLDNLIERSSQKSD